MVAISILPRAEIGQNDHREDAPHFSVCLVTLCHGDPIETFRKPSLTQFKNLEPIIFGK